MNELVLTQKIKEMIRDEFPGTYVQRVSDRFLSGIPDLRVICFGLSGDLEVKIGKGKVAPIQYKVLERIQRAGGYVGIVRSVDEARVWMYKLHKKGRVHHESSICQNS